MSTNNHEVFANGTIPLFLQNPAQSITLSPTTGTGNVNLTNSNGIFLVNGEPQGDVTEWSVFPATSNTIKMDNLGNDLTNVGGDLYFNGNLLANASELSNISDWSLYNAISDVDLGGYSTTATGGTITEANGFRTHTFTSSGTFNVVKVGGLVVSSLVVGGGGGGGFTNCAGGGGAGGAVLTTGQSLSTTSYSVVVGDGGAGGTSGVSVQAPSGQNSSFNSVIGTGGGGGAVLTNNGASGGCGGGGGYSGGLGGAGSQGGSGGNGNPPGVGGNSGGGGGGMGGNGANANTPASGGGVGGAGQTYIIGGTSYLVAGGGGGGSDYGGTGAGGSGIGGQGGSPSTPLGFGGNGVANTGSGGGGGGGGFPSPSGGNGSAGIVIISYPIGTPSTYNNLANAGNITAVSNVSAGSVTSSGAVSGTTGTFTSQVVTPVVISASNLSVSATTTLTQFCGTTLCNNAPTINSSFVNTYNILGDKGIDYTDFCITNLSNKGGKGGQINLVADAGQVTIGGVTASVGGLINITANSALTLPYNATSAIKLSAAGINIYAGAFPSELAPLGQLYMWGQAGTSLTSSPTPPEFNAVPFTNYIYATNGTRMDGQTRIKELKNFAGFNLDIHPDDTQACDITRVQFIGMGSASNANLAYPVIRGTGNAVLYGFSNVSADTISATDYTGTTIKGLTTITNSLGGSGGGTGDLTLTAFKSTSGFPIPVDTFRNITLNSSSNINLNTSNGGQVLINGSAIDAVGTWASYPASQNVDFSNFSISNLSSINSIAFSNIVRTPMIKDLDASDFSINNLALLSGDSNFYITKDTSNPLFIRNINFGGSVVVVGGSNTSTLTIGESNYDLVATGSPLTLQSPTQIQMKSTLNMSNNVIVNMPTLTSSSTLTLQGTSVLMPQTLNMSNNPIINVSTINGAPILTNPLTTTLNLSNNAITNVSTINGGIPFFNPTSVDLNMNGYVISNAAAINSFTGFALNAPAGVTINSTLSMATNPITSCPSISSLTNLTLAPAAGFLVNINAPVNMSNNVLLNVSAINGNAVFTSPSTANLNMNTYSISNVGQLTMGGIINMNNNAISNAVQIYAPSNMLVSSQGDLRLYANTNNVNPTTGAYIYVGSPGTPYHQISMQQGQGLFLGSSNFISIGGSTTYLPSPVVSQNTFSRFLSASNVAQPIIQYGTTTGTGGSGSVVVTIPTAYTGNGTYVAFAVMQDSDTARIAVNRTSASSITIVWSQGGSGTHTLAWNTMGT